MAYKIQLIYFRQTGKFLTIADATIAHEELVDIWEEVDDMRRMGRLPGLRPGAGRDLFVIIDVPDHPQRVLHMVMPPFHDEDDVTPMRIPTGEMEPLVRMPLAEIPRTTTRDVVKQAADAIKQADDDANSDTVIASDDEITPVDVPLPKPSR